MSAESKSATFSRRERRPGVHRGSARADPREFWITQFKRSPADASAWQRKFRELVDRVLSASGVELFDAVEAGVPTYLVEIIAGATGETANEVMDLSGGSTTTVRRQAAAKEPVSRVAEDRRT